MDCCSSLTRAASPWAKYPCVVTAARSPPILRSVIPVDSGSRSRVTLASLGGAQTSGEDRSPPPEDLRFRHI